MSGLQGPPLNDADPYLLVGKSVNITVLKGSGMTMRQAATGGTASQVLDVAERLVQVNGFNGLAMPTSQPSCR